MKTKNISRGKIGLATALAATFLSAAGCNRDALEGPMGMDGGVPVSDMMKPKLDMIKVPDIAQMPKFDLGKPPDMVNSVDIPFGINNSPADASFMLIEGWVNMYNVTPISPGVYNGELVATRHAPANGNTSFTVTLGQIVDFLAFSSEEDALAAVKWSFKSPPWKNFGDEGEICQIDFLDSGKKLIIGPDMRYSCANSLSYPLH